jgi:hypothetical protein
LSSRRFEATFGVRLPPWQESLASCLATLPAAFESAVNLADAPDSNPAAS